MQRTPTDHTPPPAQPDDGFVMSVPAVPAPSGKPRQIDVSFQTPVWGITPHTGLLLLVPGFGGHAQSNVYRKMQRLFSDEFDVVTIQTDYFGWRLMQDAGFLAHEHLLTFDPRQLEEDAASPHSTGPGPSHQREPIIVGRDEVMRYSVMVQKLGKIPIFGGPVETDDEYVECGPLQALDCLTAVFAVQLLLKEQGHELCRERFLAYGHSHGAFLCHLTHCLGGSFFSDLIDNAAWISPVYMQPGMMRSLSNKVIIGGHEYPLTVELVHRLSASPTTDHRIRDLSYLYAQVENHARQIIYHGTEDHLVPYAEKAALAARIPHAELVTIRPEDVDGTLFRSAGHGDSDFLALLRDAYARLEQRPRRPQPPRPKAVTISTAQARYRVDLSGALPSLAVTAAAGVM